MRKYFVPNTNWKMFYEPNDSLPEPFRTIIHTAIFDSLANVCESIFPNLISENLIIVFAPFIDSPLCFPEDNLIFLHIKDPTKYSQFVYQLGHELLHFYYKSPSNTPMFWLEEVLCEVSSHLFLQTFSKNWSHSENSIIQGFSEFTLEYSNCQLQESEPVNIKELPLNYLKNNPTGNRKLNTWIASVMLPIFKKQPKFLAECRSLSTIYAESDFNVFFNKAHNLISPDYQLELEELKGLFI